MAKHTPRWPSVRLSILRHRPTPRSAASIKPVSSHSNEHAVGGPMTTGFRPRAGLALGLVLAAGTATAQGPQRPSRVERAIEQAREVLGAAKSAGLLELP